jgi:hypothetical protein
MEIIIDRTNLYCDPLLGNKLVNTFLQHARDNRTSVARLRTSKCASLTIEDGVFRGVLAKGL